MRDVPSSPHVACIILDFFLVFLCRWPPPPPANTGLSTDCDGKWRENALRSALLASLGRYTAAVQYTDWFWIQYNRYWLNQPVPSPTFQPITQINLKYLCSSIDWCDKEIKSRCLPLGLWFPARFPSTWRSVTTSIQFHVENSILYYGVYTNIPCPALIYIYIYTYV